MGSFKKVRQFRNSLFSQVFTYGLFSTMGKIISLEIFQILRGISSYIINHHQEKKYTYLLIDISMYFPLLNLKQKKILVDSLNVILSPFILSLGSTNQITEKTL